MERKIAPVVHKVGLHEAGSDFVYWQGRPYAERIAALEEIRRDYQAWAAVQSGEHADVQPGFQRVYRIVKR